MSSIVRVYAVYHNDKVANGNEFYSDMSIFRILLPFKAGQKVTQHIFFLFLFDDRAMNIIVNNKKGVAYFHVHNIQHGNLHRIGKPIIICIMTQM